MLHRCGDTGVYSLCEKPIELNTYDLVAFMYICYTGIKSLLKNAFAPKLFIA